MEIEVKCLSIAQVIPANGQFFEFNRWKPHNNWKSAEKKDTYDPTLMMLKA